MKLIRILALATLMAGMATAQSPSSSGQKPSPTPAASPAKAGGTPVKPSAAKAKSQAAVPAKPANAAKKTVKTVTSAKTQSTASSSTTKKTASAKTPATTGPVAPVHKANVKTGTAHIVAKSAAKNVKKAPAVALKAKPPAPVAKPAIAPKPAPVAAVVVPVAEKKAPLRTGASGRRDPFVSVIRASTGTVGPGANCVQGKRCLSIPELVLQGTVRDISGKMMAVVVNSAHRTYTLRENDQVFNGSVEKITTDSIIFREFVKDAVGKETAREVVKKIGPPS